MRLRLPEPCCFLQEWNVPYELHSLFGNEIEGGKVVLTFLEVCMLVLCLLHISSGRSLFFCQDWIMKGQGPMKFMLDMGFLVAIRICNIPYCKDDAVTMAAERS